MCESSRIQQLRNELEMGYSKAFETFWREVEESGSPLVEPDPSDSRFTLCTFLWREVEPITNVRVHLSYRTLGSTNYSMVRLKQTDLWYATVRLPAQSRLVYRILLNMPPGVVPDMDSPPQVKRLYFANAQADPLNPRRWFSELGKSCEDLSLLELPDAPPQNWIVPGPATPLGSVKRYPFQSNLLGDERYLSVYTPPAYSRHARPYGLLFVFDEQWYLSRIPTSTILDNLIAKGEIPPLVAVFVGNGPDDSRSRQLPCNSNFAAFMAEELLPWVRNEYNVTTEPGFTIVAGSSYGGLAAAYLGLQCPGHFGNVLSQSGSFWWLPPQQSTAVDQAFFLPDRNYIASLVIQRPRLQLCFFLSAGSGEIDPTGKGRSILETNRHLRDVLLAKGYQVHYREVVGGHDFLNWRGTLADGLIRLTVGWNESDLLQDSV
jgi:enterochelin esterase-like enzyme